MNREDGDPLTRAVAALSFRALDLDKVSAVMREGLRQEPVPAAGVSIQGKQAVSQVRRLEASTGSDEAAAFFIAIYRYNVGLRVVEQAPNGAGTTDEVGELLHIEASFDVEYEEKVRLDEEALNAFGHKNVAYHVWPYWRELVSSTVGRMRFPHSVVVPHYVLTPRPGNADPAPLPNATERGPT